MPIFISAEALKLAVKRLQMSRARPAMGNLLIVKRAVHLDPEDVVTLSQNDPELTQAIRDIFEWVVKTDGQIEPLPLINVFGTGRQNRNGFLGPRYYSNGTSDAIDGNLWRKIVHIERVNVREARYLSPTPSEIKSLCLTGANSQLPNLLDVALWFFRRTDVEPLISQSQSKKKLGVEILVAAFIEELALSKDEAEAIFDTDLDRNLLMSEEQEWMAGEGESWQVAALANPEDYLPPKAAPGIPDLEPMTTKSDFADFDISTLPHLIHARLRERGLIFDFEFIEAFLLALKTKPFVILAGISGTGKTALPRALMEIVDNPVGVVAVAPDWTDNADMLGYFDARGDFIVGEFTKVVRDATAQPDQTFFLILDEMNLARVEYYFAQTLSGLESRRRDPDSGEIVYRDFLFNGALRERLQNSEDEELRALCDLRITSNLLIVGTVNVDETTHPFSKKVLDRANVLEVGDVDLMQGIGLPAPLELEKETPQAPAIPSHPAFFVGHITNLSELQNHWQGNSALAHLPMEATLRSWVALLEAFAARLKPHKMNFGFRVRDEVCLYLYHAACQQPEATTEPFWWSRHFDRQLVQKVLTRFGGEAGTLENDIAALFGLCVAPDFQATQKVVLDWVFQGYLDSDEAPTEPTPRFPRAARKLQRMLIELTDEEKPATSFWTA